MLDQAGVAAAAGLNALGRSPRMPVLFLGHGSPMNAIEDNEFRQDWQALGREFGQAYLEHLRDMPATGGLLPRVIAAYNAGPQPIAVWTTRFDQSDPLLFIESIPYWETRGYVPIVLRNYWIYEERTADASASRRALAAGMWPRFPGMSGPTAVRIDPRRSQTAMGRD